MELYHNNYYPFAEGEEATYLLFNSDEAFESITNIEESQLAQYITQTLGQFVT